MTQTSEPPRLYERIYERLNSEFNRRTEKRGDPRSQIKGIKKLMPATDNGYGRKRDSEPRSARWDRERERACYTREFHSIANTVLTIVLYFTICRRVSSRLSLQLFLLGSFTRCYRLVTIPAIYIFFFHFLVIVSLTVVLDKCITRARR